MDEKQEIIYNRLLAIRINIDSDPIPRPTYINEKIWECHRYIEEVEQLNIKLTRDISALQQVLNNAKAEYSSKKEQLLGREDIRQLSSIKDREAKANQLLKTELNSTRDTENELTSLNNLLRAVDLKLKNLNRVNGDIRLQVRVLEQQIKLNALPAMNPVTADLMEEMRRTSEGEDSFQGAESAVEEEKIHDPSSEVNIDDIMKDGESDVNISDLINPVPELDPETKGENGAEAMADDNEGPTEEAEDIDLSVGEQVEEDTPATIDLDDVLGVAPSAPEPINVNKEPETQSTQKDEEGGTQEEQKVDADPDQKSETEQKPDTAGLDIDDLLDSIIQKEGA